MTYYDYEVGDYVELKPQGLLSAGHIGKVAKRNLSYHSNPDRWTWRVVIQGRLDGKPVNFTKTGAVYDLTWKQMRKLNDIEALVFGVQQEEARDGE